MFKRILYKIDTSGLEKMSDLKCPFCGKLQKDEPSKSWFYGRKIKDSTAKSVASITCSRYNCECGKPFNFYLTTKNKSWTIPKSKSGFN